MGIISRLRTSGYSAPPNPRYSRGDPEPPLVGSYWTSSLTGIWEDRPWFQLVDANRGWVYTAVDKISKSIAMIPLKLYVYRNSTGEKLDSFGFKAELKSFRNLGQKKRFLKDLNLEEEPITQHPFLDLIHKPNNYMTRFDLWYHTLLRMELGGICNWLLLRDKLHVPRMIHTLPLTKFARLRPRVNNYAELEGWHYEDGEVYVDFEAEDMISLRYAHAASPWQGYGALQAQTFAYDIDLFLSEQQRAFFRNGASVGLMLSTDQSLPDKVIKQLNREIKDQYTGAMKSGETLITHSGLKPFKTGTTGRDAAVKDVGDYAREKVLTAFDLSDGAVGMVHDVNRANMEGLREQFVMDCLKPKCMLIEESLEQFLLPQYDPSLTLEFDLPFLGNEEFRLNEITQHLKTGYTVINEERAKDGLEPRDWGNKPWMPTNVQQVSDEAGDGGQAADEPDDTTGMEEGPVGDKPEGDGEGETPPGTSLPEKHGHHHSLKDSAIQMVDRIIGRLRKERPELDGQYAGWSRKKIEADLKRSHAVSHIINGKE